MLPMFLSANRCDGIDLLATKGFLCKIDVVASIIVWAPSMLIKITTSQELGLLIRAARKEQKLRMDDVAGIANVGPVFVREVERGKETVPLGRVLKLLAELGIELQADVAESVLPEFEYLLRVGVKPLTPRRRKAGSKALDAATSPDEDKS